ncbi:MAG: 30S ribosomal protein S6 [Planctomycetes bacterium]|nr:30S ribosomal protein S6 [Planctomycetota bacterium]
MKNYLYEGMFLLDNREAKKGFEASRDRVAGIITKNGGTPRVVRKWDERKLTYEIKKQKRATYMLAYFDAPQDAVTKIEREAQLTEVFLRCLIMRAESVPEKVMQEPLSESIAPQVEGLPDAVDVIDPEFEADPALAAIVKES